MIGPQLSHFNFFVSYLHDVIDSITLIEFIEAVPAILSDPSAATVPSTKLHGLDFCRH